MEYIDWHCDTLLLKNHPHKRSSLNDNEGSVDFKRMIEGDCKAQFFAVFLPSPKYYVKYGYERPADWDYALSHIEAFYKDIAEHSDTAAFAGSYEALEENYAAHKVSAMLTIEDGRLLENDIANLERLYKLGIRLISLLWNNENCLGFPNEGADKPSERGLKPFGMEAVERMQQLNMIVDVSHLSDGGFYDVKKLMRKPFIASHSCARTLCPHTRNLTDDMIRALASSGGGAGLNYMPEFLSDGSKVSRVSDMVEHIKHFINIGGEDFPMLGSDFDGIHGELELSSSADVPRLFTQLRKAGLSERQIEKVAHKNAERIIREVIG